MAKDLKSDQQIVPPAWTKLVSKAGDIVRNQKMKSPLLVPRDQLKNNTDGQHYIRDGLIQDTEVALDESPSESPQSTLAIKLEETLRQAKSETLQCEVLVPCDLIGRISSDIASMSEHEPCGLRGCLVLVSLEESKNTLRRLGKVKLEADTVATFELHLTLRRDAGGWLSLKQLVPSRLLKRVGRTPALVLSEAYTLSKKKLYRSSSRD